jgi:hypothetical protein
MRSPEYQAVLPVIFMELMGLSMLVYVISDGCDLLRGDADASRRWPMS